MSTNAILSVSQLNTYVRSVLDGDLNLNNIYLSGEISNFTENVRSGHMYLSLKDSNSSVKAVMFAFNASRLKFRPKNGMAVIARGKATLYERDGAFQFYIDDMQPEGAGSLAVAFEQLKEKLLKEGLFDSSHKKPIPQYPKRIGVISSPTGAAVQDVLNVLARRYPLAEVVFAGVPVQGEGSGERIAKAVEDFNYLDCADVLIIARGGGSAEDLWEFNNEALARAVYESGIPIISGVGHETDFTICDFVADLRAPTPSAAAEMSVPDISESLYYLTSVSERLNSVLLQRISLEELRIDKISESGFLKKPSAFIDDCESNLTELEANLNLRMSRYIDSNENHIKVLISKLDALSPLKVLLRGFSIAKNNDTVLSSVNEVQPGDDLQIQLSDGLVNAKTIAVVKNKVIL